MCLNSCFTSGNSRIFARIINYYDVCRIAYIFTTNHLKKTLEVHEQLIFFKTNCSDKSSERKGIVYLMKNKVPNFFLSKYSRNLTLLTSNLIGPESRLSLRLKAFLGRILKAIRLGLFLTCNIWLTYEWKILKIEIVIKNLWSWKKFLDK